VSYTDKLLANASLLLGEVADLWERVGIVDDIVDKVGADELKLGCWKIEFGLSEGGGARGF